MSSALERGLGILELMVTHPAGLPVSRIAALLDMPVSGVHRQLKELARLGYVRQAREQGDYLLRVKLSALGLSFLGRSGVTGFVDTRFDERFGSAALISLISAAPSAAAANVQDESAADVLEDVGDDLADATDSVIGDYLSIGPVIYVDQGARVTVMVDRDLEIF